MATKFRKIDPRMWRDERFARLTPDEKLVAVYCLTAQVNRCGIFVFSPAMAAEEIGTTPQTFRERFRNVVSGLRWQWDEERRVLYFPTWWKYNPPENGNVMAGNLKDLDDLPETPLLQAFYANTRYLPENLRRTFGERYPKPSPIQEQEQEQEQEQDLPPSEVSSEPPVLTAPTTGDGPKDWSLTAPKLAEYEATFPTLDVLAALRAACQWCRDNPAKRKTARGMPAFCSRWLTDSVNRGQFRKAPPATATGPPAARPAKETPEELVARLRRENAPRPDEPARGRSGPDEPDTPEPPCTTRSPAPTGSPSGSPTTPAPSASRPS